MDLVKSQAETMVDVLKYTVSKYGNKPIMGTREIIAELGIYLINKISSKLFVDFKKFTNLTHDCAICVFLTHIPLNISPKN